MFKKEATINVGDAGFRFVKVWSNKKLSQLFHGIVQSIVSKSKKKEMEV